MSDTEHQLYVYISELEAERDKLLSENFDMRQLLSQNVGSVIRANAWRAAAMALQELIPWEDPDDCEEYYADARQLLDTAASLER